MSLNLNIPRLEVAALSDMGRRRKNNEDAILCLEGRQVFCVADGMGGADAGEVASSKVVELIEKSFSGLGSQIRMSAEQKGRLVRRAASEASRWIWQHAAEQGMRSCGTTLVAIAFDSILEGHATVFHAGDSRAYRFRDGRLKLLTRDHSFATATGIPDEKMLPAGLQSIITRAVGILDHVTLDEKDVDTKPGDLFLLCSDGLSRMLSDTKIAGILDSDAGRMPDGIARRLVDEANRAGGQDNISVIVIRVEQAAPKDEEMKGADASSDSGAGSFAGIAGRTAVNVPSGRISGETPTGQAGGDDNSERMAAGPAGLRPGRAERDGASGPFPMRLVIGVLIVVILALVFVFMDKSRTGGAGNSAADAEGAAEMRVAIDNDDLARGRDIMQAAADAEAMNGGGSAEDGEDGGAVNQ